MSLFSLLEKSARRYPSRPAVFEGLTPRLTYHQLLRRALGLAGSLAGSIEPGDRIAIVCGDVVMAGYWRDPAATAAALRDGWLYTGDIGFVDEDGMLTLRDRSKEVIISGGTNIYPREVEEALLSHPSVAEVAVIGEPDPEWGETVVAVVVPETGHEVDSDMLDACCLQQIARFKRPRRYVVMASLPKSSYGKILKRVLKEQLRKERL